MSDSIEDQLQQLTDCIAEKCEDMELQPEQILDGIARSLIAAATAFGTKSFQLEIESHATCTVMFVEEKVDI